jgi:hypothetical protein
MMDSGCFEPMAEMLQFRDFQDVFPVRKNQARSAALIYFLNSKR